jgi:hypothetical protein
MGAPGSVCARGTEEGLATPRKPPRPQHVGTQRGSGLWRHACTIVHGGHTTVLTVEAARIAARSR